MKPSMVITRLVVALAVLLCNQRVAEACSVCFGKTNDRLQIGMNYGIAALLLAIGMTLMGITGFFVYVAARSRRTRSQLRTTPFRNSSDI